MRGINGSEVFLGEDIRRNLQAILITNELLARQVTPQSVAGYRAGFVAAIAAVATAFDIDIDPYAVPYGFLPGD
jgi:hypothetical protein